MYMIRKNRLRLLVLFLLVLCQLQIHGETTDTRFKHNWSTPSNGSTNVMVNISKVTVSFPVNISVNDTDLYDSISLSSYTEQVPINSISITDNVLEAELSQTLEYLTLYTFKIPEGALKDENGSLNQLITILFTTQDDTNTFSVLQTQPPMSGKGFDLNAPITIRYSKKIKLSQESRNIKLYQYDSYGYYSSRYQRTVGCEASISSDSKDTLVIRPSEKLLPRTSYKLLVPRNAVTDLYDRSYSSDYYLYFTTGYDNQPPYVVSSSIADGQTGVALGLKDIYINFNEPIIYSTGYSKIALTAGSTNLPLKKTINNNVLTLTVSSTLAPACSYQLTIPKDAVQDTDSNTQQEDYTITFTTIEDGVVNKIKSVSPIDDVQLFADTPFEYAVEYLLPGKVYVNLDDGTSVDMEVRWNDSVPAYNKNALGTFTFRGTIIPYGRILNPSNLGASVKVTVVDAKQPQWVQGGSAGYDNVTQNSFVLYWSQAIDDSSIKEYKITLDSGDSKQKVLSLAPSKLSKVKKEMNKYRYNENYDTYYTTITGLSAGKTYSVELTAFDLAGNEVSSPYVLNISTLKSSRTSSTYTRYPSRSVNVQPTPNSDNKDTSAVTYPSNFTDLSGYGWASEAIKALAKKGIIRGVSDTIFSPSRAITRAEFVCIMVRAFNFSADFSDNFEDVQPYAYYYDDVGKARKLGIIKGDSDNMFRPDDYITRQDMFVIFKRAIDASKITYSGKGQVLRDFLDADQIDKYAQSAADYLVKNGIIKGDGKNIKPKDLSTRAEVAVMIYNFVKNAKI